MIEQSLWSLECWISLCWEKWIRRTPDVRLCTGQRKISVKILEPFYLELSVLVNRIRSLQLNNWEAFARNIWYRCLYFIWNSSLLATRRRSSTLWSIRWHRWFLYYNPTILRRLRSCSYSSIPLPPLLVLSINEYLQPDGSADVSLFAPDCFHFSEYGHAVVGKNLWNNMLQPVGQKVRRKGRDGMNLLLTFSRW